MPDPDSSPPWYDNRSLFSDHYLEERLPHGDAWEEDVSEAWARAREIWEDTGDRLEGLNEAQTEDEFIRPVLESVLGFVATDIISNMTNAPVAAEVPGRTVRQATADDAERCNALCRQVHGFHRAGEVEEAIQWASALVVEDGNEVTGYTTGVAS